MGWYRLGDVPHDVEKAEDEIVRRLVEGDSQMDRNLSELRWRAILAPKKSTICKTFKRPEDLLELI